MEKKFTKGLTLKNINIIIISLHEFSHSSPACRLPPTAGGFFLLFMIPGEARESLARLGMVE